jgi:hypothetical protein
MARSELERLAVVEQKLDDLARTVDKFNAKLDLITATLVTQEQLTEKLTALNKDMTELAIKLERSKQQSKMQTWITSTLSAVLAVILTVLIQSYFSK